MTDGPRARLPGALHAAIWLAIAIALAVRVPMLLRAPAVEWADGASYAEVAGYIADGEGIRDWRGPHTLWPPLYPSAAAGASKVVGDPETGARVVSLASSAVAIVLGALVAAALFGGGAGSLTALLVALHPEIAQSSLTVMTEPLYAALLLGAVWVWLDAFESVSWSRLLLVGLLLGAAYLARPEALGYAVLFPALLLLRYGRSREPRRRAVAGASALLAGTLLFVLPYMGFLRAHTGEWTVSGKASYVLGLSDARLGETLEERHYLLAADDATVGLARAESGEVLREWLAHPVAHAKAYARRFMQQYRQFLSVQLHPLLAALVGVGLAFGAWRDRAWGKASLLLALFPLLVYPLNFIHRRYTILLLPLVLVWAGHGAARGWRALANVRARPAWLGRVPLTTVAAAFATVLGLGYWYRFVQSPYWVGREERMVGEWIRDDFGPGARIMERSHVAAFYAEGYWLEAPLAELDRTLAYARRHGADYLAVTPGEGHPEVQALVEPGRRPPELCLVHRVERAPSENIRKSIYLFRLRPCADAPEAGARDS